MASPPAPAAGHSDAPRGAGWRRRWSVQAWDGPWLESIPRGASIRPQVHRAAHLFQGLTGHFARLLCALGHDVAQQLGILHILLRAAAHLGHLRDDLVDHRLLAVEAADTGR